MSSSALLSLAILVLPGLLHAQTPDPLSPGRRIRVVQAPGSRPAVGVVRASDSIALSFTPDRAAEPILVPWGDIRRLEASAGHRRPLLRNALWGALGGAALGLGLSLAVGEKCVDCVDSDGGAPVVIGFTTVIGGLLGLALGSTIVEERWQPVTLPLPPPPAAPPSARP